MDHVLNLSLIPMDPSSLVIEHYPRRPNHLCLIHLDRFVDLLSMLFQEADLRRPADKLANEEPEGEEAGIR